MDFNKFCILHYTRFTPAISINCMSTAAWTLRNWQASTSSSTFMNCSFSCRNLGSHDCYLSIICFCISAALMVSAWVFRKRALFSWEIIACVSTSKGSSVKYWDQFLGLIKPSLWFLRTLLPCVSAVSCAPNFKLPLPLMIPHIPWPAISKQSHHSLLYRAW